jgi:hypothetical protein
MISVISGLVSILFDKAKLGDAHPDVRDHNIQHTGIVGKL